MSLASSRLGAILAGQNRVGNPGSPYGLGLGVGPPAYAYYGAPSQDFPWDSTTPVATLKSVMIQRLQLALSIYQGKNPTFAAVFLGQAYKIGKNLLAAPGWVVAPLHDAAGMVSGQPRFSRAGLAKIKAALKVATKWVSSSTALDGFADAAADMWAQQAGEGETVAPIPGIPAQASAPMGPAPSVVAPIAVPDVGLWDKAIDTWNTLHPGLQGIAVGVATWTALRLLRR
ncbi:MAG: hypothetical protein UY96_C0010G0004 [Parcubacteria group bacterium GW2011_GWB1_56_8]|nr:MAG: hypothetical protein UY96_C0010G0004 [Parcubacteria group bacterium GW2011_GWB1_56_8]